MHQFDLSLRESKRKLNFAFSGKFLRKQIFCDFSLEITNYKRVLRCFNVKKRKKILLSQKNLEKAKMKFCFLLVKFEKAEKKCLLLHFNEFLTIRTLI